MTATRLRIADVRPTTVTTYDCRPVATFRTVYDMDMYILLLRCVVTPHYWTSCRGAR